MKLHNSKDRDHFSIHLGTKYANLQEKIFVGIFGKKFQTFHCSNVTTMKSLGIFSRDLRKDFFLKIGMLSAKVYTKTVPNIEVCFPRNDLMCISTLHASIASKVIYYQRL